ncbi:putative leucine-rich repeat-containing, plant-type, leucine-rich repeat domain superfamily [Helianthus annuus]|uniref:Leucine-rich repeat-containing, plant-type, leucine-rich repeat domain superfamily n=1 Tax=Helianthus annuus TaxID=4232 RepID=A0A9K3E4V8_HELAN|nr:receptor-like protein EIX2 [Helianthus annuus]KAF5766919.1 putative leucine-rich repeat-containing, plant-type, leucine-rich repeat domain superfamily [Helianthus annuus]KAJ0453254.1 putative leucine-rich repeat-containing, plant-type, leucine-rich repeat domain superfamily [Helianthus annuus]KAJ0475169.1 putative leucine-rich repeat-containing, plant-type, leucine-rich repeat domain superfamily [Helianthus annuus]KAJ0650725.1 putative leucine-rich repeat-containing, plant-type, leucine-rich
MRNNIFHKLMLLILLLWLKATAIILVAATKGAAPQCIDKERNALLDFKSYIDQDPYDLLSTWAVDEETTKDCCKWGGVTCNSRTGHVTSLDLSSGDLEGKISPSLFNLSYLSHLDLQGNSFNGTTPMLNGSMTKLRYLDLSINSFSGVIPMFIGSMSRLRYLDLSTNFFNGSIPVFIGSMTRLRYLDLSYNSFSGSIPPDLGSLKNLHFLSLNSLSNCTIENIDWLFHHSHLHHLELDGISLAKANHWVNVILSLQRLSYLSLGGCDLWQVMHPYSPSVSYTSSSIISLYLGNNSLNSSTYHWLFPLTSNRLVDLDLSGNKLGVIPKYFGNFCNLTILSFDNNSMSVNLPDFLNNLSGCTSVTLQELDASSGKFTGSLSDNIQKFSSLEYLSISHNQLNGSISEKVWQLPKLETLDVSSNSLSGAISKSIGTSNIVNVNLSNNSLKGVPSEAYMSNLSSVEQIDLSSCMLGPSFPKWIQKLKSLNYLDIANTNISDTIPVEFWTLWPSQLTHLNLSSNNITGEVTNLSSNFNPNVMSRIDLSSNNFYGSIPYVPSTLEWLDLSRNKLSGGIFFLCEVVDGHLSFLDLSDNSLAGQIPDCLWNFKALKVLNLGQNKLSGRLPASIGYLTNLEVLYLYNNNFFGELPPSLNNCTKLFFLQLQGNKFSGHMPVWIGENLSELYALNLASNNFFGTIPLQLCQLAHLRILDLSKNNLYGTIPLCLNNLTAMVQEGLPPHENVQRFIHEHMYVDHAFIKWKGYLREFNNNLRLLKYIDLSCNNLTGKIPYGLTDLHELIALNLSTNTLLGEIPPKIGEMRNLQILDLSRNKFSGGIPPSMSHMTSLDYMDVSYNNLSGRIPSGTQLQTFEPTRYTGNTGLCGPPLTKYCPGDKELEVAPLVYGSEGEGEDDIQIWFYIGGGTGFATGFWIACVALLVNPRGRKAFFHFLDISKDWVCVKLMMLIAK